jgi:hypothetical protein
MEQDGDAVFGGVHIGLDVSCAKFQRLFECSN